MNFNPATLVADLFKFGPKLVEVVRDVLKDSPAIRDAVKQLVADVEKDLGIGNPPASGA